MRVIETGGFWDPVTVRLETDEIDLLAFVFRVASRDPEIFRLSEEDRLCLLDMAETLEKSGLED